jgi:LPXTG-site transpeptidase (sortase) family protein
MGTVEVQKYACPSAVDADTLDLAALLTECPDPHAGIHFMLIEGNQVAKEGDTALDGTVSFDTVPVGSYALVEGMSDELSPARVFCHSESSGAPVQDWIEYQIVDGTGIDVDVAANQTIACNWFNVPAERTGTIEILKYACELDPGAGVLEDLALLDSCASLDGIEFTLQGDTTTSIKVTGDPEPGLVRWDDLPEGAYTVSETVPEGYGQPAVYCDHTYSDGPVDLLVAPISGTSVDVALDANMTIRCLWINLPLENGSITIYKHLCPPGYDIYASGVDPWIDCTDNANGVGFWLNGAEYQQTGNWLDSAVAWAGLAPGSYLVTEDVPPHTKTVFVLKCEGNSAPMIQNYPVSIGSEFQLYVESGDEIVCHWYNVPKAEHSTITVVKYACSTETFVSSDYCQLYESGAGFELSQRSGDANSWSFVSSGQTNANGTLTFDGLQDGIYQVDEIESSWCYATADYTDAQGYLVVENNDVTVWVYNCGITLPKPKPVEYPNTGSAPSAPTAAGPFAPVVPAEHATVLNWRTWSGIFDYRLTAPFASSGKPVRIEIAKIGLSAEIESLEVVGGAFQEPTTAEQVAWYKDTGWLGQPGNIVMAGHLNYWGVPEGVFFSLDNVASGDIIELTADDGTVYRYTVTSVQLLPANATSLQSVTADTNAETLTLITCGGEWDGSTQHYLHRTVVQAERIP